MTRIQCLLLAGVLALATPSGAQTPTSDGGEANMEGTKRTFRALAPESLSDKALDRLVGDSAVEPPPSNDWAGDLEPIPDELARRLLKRICVGGRREGDDGGLTCQRCPDFTTRAGTAGEFRLARIVRGAFIEKSASELFVTYEGCEPERAASGGAIVFRKHRGNWEPYYRHPGLNPDQCLSLGRDRKRDHLVCRLESRANGRRVDRVFTVRSGGNRTLVEAVDDSARCKDGEVRGSFLRGWHLESKESERRVLVVAKVERRTRAEAKEGAEDESSDGDAETAEKSQKQECDEGAVEWARQRAEVHRFQIDDGKVRRQSVEKQDLEKTESAEPGTE